jgi:hypothetical protein
VSDEATIVVTTTTGDPSGSRRELWSGEHLEIDLTRVPRGELAARVLVAALAQTDDRAERHFLEIKSSVDLKSKEGIAKVAKFILGAANRMPDVARPATSRAMRSWSSASGLGRRQGSNRSRRWTSNVASARTCP